MTGDQLEIIITILCISSVILLVSMKLDQALAVIGIAWLITLTAITIIGYGLPAWI